MARRSRSNAPFIIILLLAVGLTATLIWGARWIGQDRATAFTAGSRTIESGQITSISIARVRMVIGNRGVLTYGISRFKLRAGRLPSSLSDLVRRPASLDESQAWHGPYVNTEGLLIDPWENAYAYRAPGIHNAESYDLWSLGPDGQDDTGDEIGNWNLPEDYSATGEDEGSVSSLASGTEHRSSFTP